MIKPSKLKTGDKVAIVSLSRGLLGEDKFIHILDIAKKRLEQEYGLEVVIMPNALMGNKYLYEHPEARAEDLMNGIIMGKPPVKEKYDSYKEILFDIVSTDGKHNDLPIIYNVNFGHAYPIGIIPFGLKCELDCDNKKISIIEKLVK